MAPPQSSLHFILFLTLMISITHAHIYLALNSGCLYGDGYIKLFAGESTEDSALLAHVSAEFESILSIVSHHHTCLYEYFFAQHHTTDAMYSSF